VAKIDTQTGESGFTDKLLTQAGLIYRATGIGSRIFFSQKMQWAYLS
jgi:hypothetical protein